MKKGFFVAIEGGDGSGKSTLIKGLKKYFPNAVFTFEPGGTKIGVMIRKLLFKNEVSSQTEMFLFCASRNELVSTIIEPSLKQNKMVITDRYVFSSYVYQALTGGLDFEMVKRVNEFATKGIMPDLVIYLKVSKCLRNGTKNRFDRYSNEKVKKVYDGFDFLSTKPEYNFFVIDAEANTKEQVLELAKNKIMEKMNAQCEIG